MPPFRNNLAYCLHKRLLVERELRNILSESTEEGQYIREELGSLLKNLVYADYLKKANGGADSTGYKWPPTKKGVPVMIDTERLLASLEYNISDAGVVEVHFSIFPPENADDDGRLIAFHQRPAWPADEFPKVWVDALYRRLRELIASALRRRQYLRTQ